MIYIKKTPNSRFSNGNKLLFSCWRRNDLCPMAIRSVTPCVIFYLYFEIYCCTNKSTKE